MSKTINLVTQVPGPRSVALKGRRSAAVPKGVANVTPIFAEHGRGATLIDVDGNTFIDFAGGIGVMNIGYGHPEVNAAIHAQVDRFLHTCFHVAMYEPYVQLAEELITLMPGSFPKKAVLLNSGAEAVENAIKLARRYSGRPAVITFENAFHGRTLLSMSLTAKASTYKYGFGPFAPEIYRAPFPELYHSPFATPEETVEYAFAALRRLVENELSPDKVAAVILEPVQGEGGFLVTPTTYMRKLAEYCRQHGIIFIADEIQSGFCRTGTWFAVEQYDVEPDMILTAKSMGGGLPIAAVVGRAEIMDSAQVGGLGGTYGGNPVACAAALQTIKVMRRDRFDEKARAVGERVMAAFREFARKYALVGDVRGLGAMAAMELVSDRKSRQPAISEAIAVFRYCLEHGLILMKAGQHNHVIRFLAPLTIERSQLDEGLAVLDQALSSVSGAATP